jgi:hypothetical protein
MKIALVLDGAECYNSRGISRLSYGERRWMQPVLPQPWYLYGRISHRMMPVIVTGSQAQHFT